MKLEFYLLEYNDINIVSGTCCTWDINIVSGTCYWGTIILIGGKYILNALDGIGMRTMNEAERQFQIF